MEETKKKLTSEDLRKQGLALADRIMAIATLSTVTEAKSTINDMVDWAYAMQEYGVNKALGVKEESTKQ